MEGLSANQIGRVSALSDLRVHPNGTPQLTVEIASPVQQGSATLELEREVKTWVQEKVSYLNWNFFGEQAQKYAAKFKIGQVVEISGIPLGHKASSTQLIATQAKIIEEK